MADDEEKTDIGGSEKEVASKYKEGATEPRSKNDGADDVKEVTSTPEKTTVTQGTPADGGGAAGGTGNDSDDWRIKNVKAKKNQFAINRLLLMFLDIKPEELTAETVDDLKKIYSLLVHIHSIYTTLPP